jgi:Mg2+-importing ATPase
VEEFRTGWFIESLLTELAVALVVRTRRWSFKSRPGKWLWISTVLVVALTIAIPYLPGVSILGFVPLPAPVMALIVGITLLYVIATDAAKMAFYRRFSV